MSQVTILPGKTDPPVLRWQPVDPDLEMSCSPLVWAGLDWATDVGGVHGGFMHAGDTGGGGGAPIPWDTGFHALSHPYTPAGEADLVLVRVGTAQITMITPVGWRGTLLNGWNTGGGGPVIDEYHLIPTAFEWDPMLPSPGNPVTYNGPFDIQPNNASCLNSVPATIGFAQWLPGWYEIRESCPIEYDPGTGMVAYDDSQNPGDGWSVICKGLKIGGGAVEPMMEDLQPDGAPRILVDLDWENITSFHCVLVSNMGLHYTIYIPNDAAEGILAWLVSSGFTIDAVATDVYMRGIDPTSEFGSEARIFGFNKYALYFAPDGPPNPPPSIDLLHGSFSGPLLNGGGGSVSLTIETSGPVTAVEADLRIIGGSQYTPVPLDSGSTYILNGILCSNDAFPTDRYIKVTATDGLGTTISRFVILHIDQEDLRPRFFNGYCHPYSILNDGATPADVVAIVYGGAPVEVHADLSPLGGNSHTTMSQVGGDRYAATFNTSVAPGQYSIDVTVETSTIPETYHIPITVTAPVLVSITNQRFEPSTVPSDGATQVVARCDIVVTGGSLDEAHVNISWVGGGLGDLNLAPTGVGDAYESAPFTIPGGTQAGVYGMTFSATSGVVINQQQADLTITDPGGSAPVFGSSVFSPNVMVNDNMTTCVMTATFSGGDNPTGVLAQMTWIGMPSDIPLIDRGGGTWSTDPFVIPGTVPVPSSAAVPIFASWSGGPDVQASASIWVVAPGTIPFIDSVILTPNSIPVVGESSSMTVSTSGGIPASVETNLLEVTGIDAWTSMNDIGGSQWATPVVPNPATPLGIKNLPVRANWFGPSVISSGSIELTGGGGVPTIDSKSVVPDAITGAETFVLSVSVSGVYTAVQANLIGIGGPDQWINMDDLGGGNFSLSDLGCIGQTSGIKTIYIKVSYVGGAVNDTITIDYTEAPPAPADAWARGHVAEDYSCTVVVDPGVDIVAVRKVYPTPNWITDVEWDNDAHELTIQGLPNLAGYFTIAIEGQNGSGDWVAMPAPEDNPHLLVNEANYRPSTQNTIITGSKNYIVQPGDAVQIVTINGNSDPVLDPDMLFANQDQTNSMLLVVSAGGRMIGVPPTITTGPSSVGSVNAMYHYDGQSEHSGPEATGTGIIRWNAVSSPLGFNIHPITGEISWMPEEAGVYHILIRASNDAGYAEQAITVTVTVIPTVITSEIPDTIPNGAPYIQQIVADGSPIIHFGGSIAPSDPTFHVSLSGLLTFEPHVATPTDFTITITATGPGGVDTQQFPVSVEP